MERNGKLLGYYNYTVILTYIGMLSGFVGIVCAFEASPLQAIVCLIFAGLCDMFDGAIASTMKSRTRQEKCFGIQIDSLSDLICFGVLPASILSALGEGNILALIVSAFYVLCALIRLAYFNVDEQERQASSTGSRKLYYGVPVTISALAVPLLYCMCCVFIGSAAACNIVLAAAFFILAALFLIPIPLKKPHTSGKIIILLCGAAEVIMLILVF